MDGVELILGDCLDVLGCMGDCTVDSIVTDPPYGLSFMGKKWDYDVPVEDVWRECLRVLKPGGHLLAFAGTRTQHRMAVRIEDAGFEIRDMIAWVYGSGFPKSLDVSKALDKAAGAEREVVGNTGRDPNRMIKFKEQDGCKRSPTNEDITAPATESARQWAGFGTALKPSLEPLTWATKPLTTVPYSDMVRAEQTIGGLICLSLSHAKHAENLLRSTPSECGEASASALLIAAVHRGLSSADPSGVTDMFKSPETARTILSIAESWSAILGAYCERQNRFTTSTATSLTTALRTFTCLTSQTIADAITLEGAQMLGRLMSAPIVEPDLSVSSAKPAESTSAHGLVSWLTARSIASVAESSFIPAARIASSVLHDAITSLGESARPALEPITVARKPFPGTVAANVLAHGTGAINVDGCRVDVADGATTARKPAMVKDTSAPFGKGAAMGGNGSPLGRWPANLIHDGSDEVVGLFPQQNGVVGARWEGGDNLIFSGGRRTQSEKQRIVGGAKDSGSAARFFYCAKASKRDRDEGCEGLEGKAWKEQGFRDNDSTHLSPRAGAGRTSLSRNHHPTVKPTDLMRYLCRLVTPPGGTVLDPFMGSGSTGKGAVLEGFRFIGIEREAEYVEIARARIAAACSQLSFGGM